MNNREAHFYLEELQRMMTQHRGIFSEEFVCANGMAIQALEQKQKEGRWIRLTNDLAQCSECKDYIDFAILCGYNFCPNCGAKMKEE